MCLFAADGLAVDDTMMFIILGGAVTVIGSLFWMLYRSKDREIDTLRKLLEAETSAVEVLNKEHARIVSERHDHHKIEVKDLEDRIKSLWDVAQDSTRSAREMLNFYRQKEGKPPLAVLASVVPESNSPSTVAQRETARLQTLRAEMEAIKLMAGQAPKPEPDHAYEPDRE